MRIAVRGVCLLVAAIVALPLVAQGPEGRRRGRSRRPVLHLPRFVPAAEANFLKDTDRVIGISGNGVAKAYKVPQLAWHHIVHDQLGKIPILATW